VLSDWSDNMTDYQNTLALCSQSFSYINHKEEEARERDTAHTKNYGPGGIFQAHSSVVTVLYAEPKSDGVHNSQKSMANNKSQGELQLTKTELNTSKHHLHAKAFPHVRK